MPNYFYRVHKVCSASLNTLRKTRKYSSLQSIIHDINCQFMNSCKFDISTSFGKQWFDFHLLWFGLPKGLSKCLKTQLFFVSLLAIIFTQIVQQNKNFIARQNQLQKIHMEIKSFSQSLLAFNSLLQILHCWVQFLLNSNLQQKSLYIALISALALIHTSIGQNFTQKKLILQYTAISSGTSQISELLFCSHILPLVVLYQQ